MPFDKGGSISIEKHFEYVVTMKVDATVYQEHKIPTSDQEKGYAWPLYLATNFFAT